MEISISYEFCHSIEKEYFCPYGIEFDIYHFTVSFLCFLGKMKKWIMPKNGGSISPNFLLAWNCISCTFSSIDICRVFPFMKIRGRMAK